MNNKLYTLLLVAPMLFTACNTEPTPTATTTGQEIKKAKEVITKQAETQTIVTIENDVKYVKKPLIEEQGLLHIQSFVGTLQPTLESAIKSDNTYQTAMGVCSSMAMEMTNEYNNQSTEVKVRRTALKYRNEKNSPDTTDRKVMEVISSKLDFKPVTIDMGDHYRVYKPLPTKKKCLACHGDSSRISPKILKSIKSRYPKDLAIGHIEGDLKGAIVAEIQK